MTVLGGLGVTGFLNNNYNSNIMMMGGESDVDIEFGY